MKNKGITLGELRTLLDDKPRYKEKLDPVKVEEMIQARRLWFDLFDVFAISRYDFNEAYRELEKVLERYGFKRAIENS